MKISHAIFPDGYVSPVVEDWGPSLTKQSFTEECDLNRILAKVVATGEFPDVPLSDVPRFMDCSSVPHFQEALNILRASSARFEMLPAALRKKFESPEGMVLFCEDPKNLPELILMGLAVDPEVAKAAAAAKAPASSADIASLKALLEKQAVPQPASPPVAEKKP